MRNSGSYSLVSLSSDEPSSSELSSSEALSASTEPGSSSSSSSKLKSSSISSSNSSSSFLSRRSSSSDFFLKMININVSPTEMIDNPYDKIESPTIKMEIARRTPATVSDPERGPLAAGTLLLKKDRQPPKQAVRQAVKHPQHPAIKEQSQSG
ncbi:MAG TPA: hypothetical protein EYO16_08415 [Candidatus Marinimicrobia bacterium]|nr:hypothetical protein [Candidatus Neomarinimicrobiota bacterium]